MTYKVIITTPAKHQLEMYVSYVVNELNNPKAAKSIIEDAKKTKIRLSELADSLPLCTDNTLAHNGYRRILFSKYAFFMVYRIDGNTVIVEAMYHELQDYESVFTQNMNLK